jgi:hypothetical protein
VAYASLAERNAALQKLLRRSHGGIQCVTYRDLNGEEAFAAAWELGIDGHGFEAADGALQVGALQELDQGPASEVAEAQD